MLHDKNIVVTGCLQGIGKKTLEIFAHNGANVFACAYKHTDEFETLCNELAVSNSVKVIPIYFDLMDNESIKEAVKQIQREKLDIHGLVNIAGINKDAMLGMITQEDMQDTFQVNVFSQIVFTQYISRIMKRNGKGGSIVFTSSIAALDGTKGQVVYSASKAALIGAAHSMAIELGEYGIRVNAVAPGVIDTLMTQELSEEIKKDRIAKMDIPRLGSTSDVANVYMYLMSDLSSHVTSQVIRVDGGM